MNSRRSHFDKLNFDYRIKECKTRKLPRNIFQTIFTLRRSMGLAISMLFF